MRDRHDWFDSRHSVSTASFLPGPAGLDSSAADPGMALAQVQDEAWELEVAPAQERAPGARASGSCQSSYAESAPLPRQHHAAQSKNDEFLAARRAGVKPPSPPRSAKEQTKRSATFASRAAAWIAAIRTIKPHRASLSLR